MTRFRAISVAELGTVLDWAAVEGWNPGLGDAAAFHAADPEGFFLATQDGVPVAAISVVNHSEDFAFLGLYICRPDFRGTGIGYRLWQHALTHGEGRTVGLDGVPAQQANYSKSGFVLAGETVRYVGNVTPVASGFRLANPDDIPALFALEAEASAWRKADYMRAWFTNTDDRKTLVAERAGMPVGVATVRKCRIGAKIGPLVAPDAETARALIGHAATLFGEEVTLDVPSTAPALAALCRDLQLEPGFNTARMYRGTVKMPPPGIYAVATLELG